MTLVCMNNPCLFSCFIQLNKTKGANQLACTKENKGGT